MGLLDFPVKIIVLLFSALYVISPIDLVPEMVLGPLGFIDDIMVIFVAMGVLKGKAPMESITSNLKLPGKKVK